MSGRTELSEASDELMGSAIDFIARLGPRANSIILRGLGIPREALRRHVDGVLHSLSDIRAAGLAEVPGAGALFDALEALRREAPRTFRKTLARIAGISVIPSGLRDAMGADGERRAFVANALYEAQQDLLDDLLDRGGYTFGEARRMYRLCLRPITGAADTDHLEADLTELMGPGQDGVATLLAALTREIRALVRDADPEVLRRLEEGHERLATAQAATVFLVRDAFDPDRLMEIAATLPVPFPGMMPLDRLAVAASWTSNLALLDACLAETPISPDRLDAHERAWLHFNAAVSYLEHYANVARDLGDGLLNIATITTHGADATPHFSAQERDEIFAKAWESLAAGVAAGEASGADLSYYSFLSFAIPAAIFALCGTPEDEIDAFFDLQRRTVAIPGLPLCDILAELVALPDAPGLHDPPPEPPEPEDPLVDSVEHRTHRGGRHPVEVTERRPPALRCDLEAAEVPLLPIHDRCALREGLQRQPLRELPLDRREGGPSVREQGSDERVAPVPEPGLRELEELRAGIDGDPGVLQHAAGVDRPVPDRLRRLGGALRFPQGLEEPEDARPADLRHEPDVGNPAGRGGDEPTARAVEVREQRGPRLRDPVHPAPRLRFRVQALHEAPPPHLPQGAAHVGDPEGGLPPEVLRELRLLRQGVEDPLPVAARGDEAEVLPEPVASGRHRGPFADGRGNLASPG